MVHLFITGKTSRRCIGLAPPFRLTCGTWSIFSFRWGRLFCPTTRWISQRCLWATLLFSTAGGVGHGQSKDVIHVFLGLLLKMVMLLPTGVTAAVHEGRNSVNFTWRQESGAGAAFILALVSLYFCSCKRCGGLINRLSST
jgi:hypothetical protein